MFNAMKLFLSRLLSYKKYIFIIKDYNRNNKLNQITLFANNCTKMALQLQADTYISHDVESLLALNILTKNQKKVLTICDVVETPSFKVRNSPMDWPYATIELVDDIIEYYLAKVDKIWTVGWSMEKKLQKYNKEISVIPNYREYDKEYKKTDLLRKKFNLKNTDKILLVVNHISNTLENILLALTQLDENIHLVVIGNIRPKKYRTKIDKYIKKYHLKKRFHEIRYVEYNRLLSFISGADVGLICLDNYRENSYLSLPNRIFDLMAGALPIVSPNIPDISYIINKFQNGVIINDLSANEWVKGIREAFLKQSEFSKNSIRASKKYTWKKSELILLKQLYKSKKVTFLGVKNLYENQRVLKMALSLAKSGIKVNICSNCDKKSYIVGHENITYLPIINPLLIKTKKL